MDSEISHKTCHIIAKERKDMLMSHKLSQLFKNAEIASNIIMNAISLIQTVKNRLVIARRMPKLALLVCGALAEHVTVDQILAECKRKEFAEQERKE